MFKHLSRLFVVASLTMPYLLCAAPARAQAIPAQIDTYMRGLYRQKKFNGVVLVADKGNIIYEKSFGFAQYQPRTPLTNDSLFNLASVSKEFTAMAIMMLKEQGRLQYDDDVRKYVPELPYSDITIRQLLHHTSGLPDYIELADKNWDSDKIMTNKDVLAILKQYKPAPLFKPGEKYEYSNTGYQLLASVVERVSGKRFPKFMHDAIFAPLGMTSTVVYTAAAMKPFAARRAYGYDPKGRGYELDDMGYLDGIWGDGGIYSTVDDLLRWDQALYGKTLVSRKTLLEAFTPGRLNSGKKTDYGFGWNIEEDSVWHDGSWVGFRTFIDRFLQSRKTIIILTNTSCENLGDIDRKITAILGE